ncbi:PAS domain S-box protein [Billgrantia sp. C5P2]|uniref:PAS domain S-box protein n=1 Tax=Billgrantia sp. C5P2 TaxID=3436239 RepID=UPI003DA48666
MRYLFRSLRCLWPSSRRRLRSGSKACQGDSRFRLLLESLPNVAVQGYDRKRRVIYWNEESVRLYGYQAEEAAGRYLEELIIPEPMQAQVIRDHSAWLREGKAIPPGRLVLRDKQGNPVPVYSYHVMLDEFSEDPVMFCVDVRLDTDLETVS